MVVLGGLEIVAAGYLIHQHNKHKRERANLRDVASAIEDSQYTQEPRRHRRHSQSHSHTHSRDREESREERHERHRRRRSRERKDRDKWERGSSKGSRRDHSAPPKMHHATEKPVVVQTQRPQPGGFPPTGWPSHWQQSQTPPTPPPQPQRAPVGPNGYPEDVKYGFVPEVPHDQYPEYPPPPFSPGPWKPSTRGRTGSDTLEVNDARRGRRKSRRTPSPMLGEHEDEEYSRSPAPRVRFSTEDVVLGGSGSVSDQPPPRYRA